MNNTLGRKVFYGVIMFSMVLSLAPVFSGVQVARAAVTPVACSSLQPGDFIKVEGKPAIFGIDASGMTRYWAEGAHALSRFSTYKAMNYKYVTQDCVNSLKTPTVAPMLIPSGAGTEVFKYDEFDQWYVRLPGAMAPVSQTVAKALYGSNVVPRKISLRDWPHFAVCKKNEYKDSIPHAGQVIKVGNTMYWVGYGKEVYEVTANGMSANKLLASYVRTWPESVLANYTKKTAVDSYNAMIGDVHQQGWDCNSDPAMGTWTKPVGAPTPSSTIPGVQATVSLAGDNPAAGYLASGTGLNPVLKLTLTPGNMDANVTAIKVKKEGFVVNNKITGIDVIDSSGKRHGNVVSSLTAEDTATILMPGDPIMLKAGVPQTVTVRVTLDSTATAGTLRLGVADASYVTVANGTTLGTFPVWGNIFSLQDGSTSVGAVTFNVQTVNANGVTLNMDATNAQEITKFRIAETSSREGLQLKSLTLYNNGTASDSDVKDVQLVTQDGTVLATAQMVNKNVVFDLSAAPYLIDKGQTRDLTVRTKIVSGAGRTIQFEVYNNYDVVLVGTSSHANLLPTTTSGGTDSAGTSFPVGNDTATNKNKVTIGNGTLSFNKDVTSPSNSVTPGASNVVLAKFFAKPTGENMELRRVALAIATTTPGASVKLSGSLSIKLNGSSIYNATASDISTNSTSLTAINLNSYMQLTNNQNNYITVEGNISNSATGNDTYRVYLDITEVKRLGTNDIVDPSVAVSSGNTIAVQAAQLTVTNLSVPVDQSVVVGTSDFTLAKVELNANGSGEDARVSKVTFADVKSAGAAYADVSGLTLYQVTDAGEVSVGTSNSTAVNAATVDFNFLSALVVTRDKPVVLVLKGNIVGQATTTATDSHKFGATSTVATGNVTGNTITATISSNAGQTMTIVSGGGLTVSLVSGDNKTPSVAATVPVNTKDKVVFAFKLSAQQEAAKITTLKLTATGTTLKAPDLANIRLFLNSSNTPFATANQLTCSSNTCTYTWTANDNVLPSAVDPASPATVYVKADVGAAGDANLGDDFSFAIASNSTDLVAKGAFSSASSTISGTAVALAKQYITNGQVLVEGVYPSAGSSVNVSGGDGTVIATFKVRNLSGSKITLTHFSAVKDAGTNRDYALYVSNEGSDSASTLVDATTTNSFDFGSLTTSTSINSGTYRTVSIKLNGGSASSGDSWRAIIDALGNVKYSVDEADLGYSGNPSNDSDLSDTITDLYADGTPALGTAVKP